MQTKKRKEEAHEETRETSAIESIEELVKEFKEKTIIPLTSKLTVIYESDSMKFRIL